VTTDGTGHAAINDTLPVAVGPAQFITATATDPGGNTSEFSQDIATPVPTTDLSITANDSPDPVTAGTNLTYTLTVHTAGPSDAQAVVVSDPLPAGTSFVSASNGGSLNAGTVSWNLGTIPAGAANTTLTLIVHVGAAQTTGLSNTSTVSSTTPDPNTGNNTATATTTIARSTDLSITANDSPDPVTAGTNLTYTLTVHTAGPSDAQAVVVSDPLPAGTSFVSASNGGRLSAGTVSWNLGTIPAGAADTTLTLIVHVGAAQTTGLSNTATVSSTTPDPNPGNNTVSATTVIQGTPPGAAALADLAVTGAGAPASVGIGGDWTITLTVTNRGPAPASGVTLVNPLPAGVEFVSTSGGTFDSGRQVIAVPFGALETGSSATVTLVLRPTAAGTITDTATATANESDPDPANNQAVLVNVITPMPTGPVGGSPPTVLGVQRFGFHAQPTRLVVNFNGLLDPVCAQDLRNYRLVAPGRDGRFGTRDDRVLVVRSASYDPTRRTVTLAPAGRLKLRSVYQLTISAAAPGGVADTNGCLLDGNRDAVPGGNYVGLINKYSLAGRVDRSGALRPFLGSARYQPGHASTKTVARLLASRIPIGQHHRIRQS
jgi:uncharacterized repeat protein (TIGR01451 family)